jgi:hypothetical protein
MEASTVVSAAVVGRYYLASRNAEVASLRRVRLTLALHLLERSTQTCYTPGHQLAALVVEQALAPEYYGCMHILQEQKEAVD